MARKTMTRRRLHRTSSPSSEHKPSPPPSLRGHRRRMASLEPKPSPPRSSRGKRPLEEDEAVPPSPTTQPHHHAFPTPHSPNAVVHSYLNHHRGSAALWCLLLLLLQRRKNKRELLTLIRSGAMPPSLQIVTDSPLHSPRRPRWLLPPVTPPP
ncbi:hypothetical protein PIB30_034475 [Stylosanthes scabra]|uniref:Uncharacterized protein n=1 Tax=Stylosanthes scabra TaxID=79078 RepID=A0ABU6VCJ7_9FABA|nr:hypothetical protein [Stylosanthes scabra]